MLFRSGNTFFRNVSLGNLHGTYKYIGVAPMGLKPLVMRGLDREIGRARAGRPAQVFLKMNSLTDRDVIDKISEASEAGVKVLMIVRGICCIRANIPGRTDGLVVREIVGRFLEHARVYAFGIDADTIYLSSADMPLQRTNTTISCIVTNARLTKAQATKVAQMAADAYEIGRAHV